ncbi:MAG TPA: Asp-tRNA(Asn)/Glu-tRNA(Gln) amidotransferase subunit GatA [Burkholderiaceae bacterium]|nr:Asp-tRNA(Asn)/Glu-tRNA(Gln) amidotransferase subunit GatA [Burkholderiaceae bacterium]
MSDAPLHTQFNSIADLRQAVATRKISAEEITKSALDAIQASTDLNAFLHVDPELSLAQARDTDHKLARDGGDAMPLAGIPVAHKDLLVTRGWRTTAASKMLADYVSPFDATVVRQLRDAGAVSLGKLNCDEFGMGSSNENSAFGPVRNPWNPDVNPGGSSGGSAAAVAAGLIMGATATDTGGSIRRPSAMCGVSGIKPTYGTVSRFGIIANGSSLDQAGPIARSALDLLELLDPVAAFDPADSTSLQYCGDTPNQPGRIRADFNQQVQAAQTHESLPLKGLRIGVPEEFVSTDIAPDVVAAIRAALQQLESLGAERVSISLPRTLLSVPAYYVIGPAESSSNLSRFDGVRYGHRTQNYSDLDEMIRRSRAEGFGNEVMRRIMVGTYVLSHGYYDAYYLQAQRLRRLITDDFRRTFAEHCDVIMGPVAPSVARPLGAKGAPTEEWTADVFTVGANLAGLPAMSIPCGFDPQHKLPIGLQIIGNYFREGQLLAIANAYQNVTDWHQRKPEQQ